MSTWVIFEGVPCTDLKIDSKDWAEAQQIATIVPSGTLYKIDRGSTMLHKVPDKLQEVIVKGFIEAFSSKMHVSRTYNSRLYYSYQERKIMCFLDVELDKEGLSSIVYSNDGTGMYIFDRGILSHKSSIEHKGKNIKEVYGLPDNIDMRPTIQTLSKLEVSE